MACIPCLMVPILLLIWRFLIQPMVMAFYQFKQKGKPEAEHKEPPELVKECQNGVCTLGWKSKATEKTD